MPPAAMFMPAQLKLRLQASIDGLHLVDVATFSLDSGVQYSLSFPALEAQYLRLVFDKNSNVNFIPPSSVREVKPLTDCCISARCCPCGIGSATDLHA